MNEVAILERSVGYALGCLALVPGTPAGSPTPCRSWNLLDLLSHLDDSSAVLAEAVRGDVGASARPAPAAGRTVDAAGLAAAIGARSRHALGEWIVSGTGHEVRVADRSLPARAVVLLGALELALHGWDVAMACGEHRPLPAELATDLLEVATILVDAEDRPGRFGPVLPVLPVLSRLPQVFVDPEDRLLAFLGRRAPAQDAPAGDADADADAGLYGDRGRM